MGFYVGGRSPESILVGSREASAVYLGGTCIWRRPDGEIWEWVPWGNSSGTGTAAAYAADDAHLESLWPGFTVRGGTYTGFLEPMPPNGEVPNNNHVWTDVSGRYLQPGYRKLKYNFDEHISITTPTDAVKPNRKFLAEVRLKRYLAGINAGLAKIELGGYPFHVTLPGAGVDLEMQVGSHWTLTAGGESTPTTGDFPSEFVVVGAVSANKLTEAEQSETTPVYLYSDGSTLSVHDGSRRRLASLPLPAGFRPEHLAVKYTSNCVGKYYLVYMEMNLGVPLAKFALRTGRHAAARAKELGLT